MVQQCYLCKVYKHQVGAESLSFHSLPKDPERRNIWMSVLGLDKHQYLPKRVEKCSRHFQENDMVCGSEGQRTLKRDAIPILSHSVFDSSVSTSSESSISPLKHEDSDGSTLSVVSIGCETTARKQLFMGEEICYLPGPSNQEQYVHTSSTLSASETENLKQSPVKISEEQACVTLGKKKRKRKIRYVGDLSSEDFSSPKKAKKNFRALKSALESERKKTCGLQTTVTSLRKRIRSLSSLLKLLRSKQYTTESSENVLKESLPGSAAEIFERMLKGPSTQKYSPEIRSFALTLAFYSPRAYNFVRKTFNRSLPHINTISKWYQSVDGSPGFTKEALNALKMKKQETAVQGKEIFCNLVLDEMSIRKQVEWTGSKFSGYVDIGTQVHSDILPEAKEVLVFMLVSLNGYWKIPVGYFFLDGLSGAEKAEVVKHCLTFINQSGVTVTSITFDGAPVNFTMATRVGANFSVNNARKNIILVI